MISLGYVEARNRLRTINLTLYDLINELVPNKLEDGSRIDIFRVYALGLHWLQTRIPSQLIVFSSLFIQFLRIEVIIPVKIIPLNFKIFLRQSHFLYGLLGEYFVSFTLELVQNFELVYLQNTRIKMCCITCK